jgi:protein-S-isoprenylcysteine O-methyltransferase Ste14
MTLAHSPSRIYPDRRPCKPFRWHTVASFKLSLFPPNATQIFIPAGWWGISRHFHYVPEILAAVFWTLPAGNHPLAWFYVFFLTLLLTDRSFRDDQRCLSKYGVYWKKYCDAVPYRMIPYIY